MARARLLVRELPGAATVGDAPPDIIIIMPAFFSGELSPFSLVFVSNMPLMSLVLLHRNMHKQSQLSQQQ